MSEFSLQVCLCVALILGALFAHVLFLVYPPKPFFGSIRLKSSSSRFPSTALYTCG